MRISSPLCQPISLEKSIRNTMPSFSDWIIDERSSWDASGKAHSRLSARRRSLIGLYHESCKRWRVHVRTERGFPSNRSLAIVFPSDFHLKSTRLDTRRDVERRAHALSWSNKAPMLFSSCAPIPGTAQKLESSSSQEKFKLREIAKGIELPFDQTRRAVLAHGSGLRNTSCLVSSHQSRRNLIYKCVRLLKVPHILWSTAEIK